MRYIDADAFLENECDAYNRAQSQMDDNVTWMVNSVVHQKVQMLIRHTPTADVIEVVRCKHCARMQDYNDKQHCEALGIYVKGDDYCSWGEKKDGVE